VRGRIGRYLIATTLLAACAPAGPPLGPDCRAPLEVSVTQGRADEVAGVLVVEVENALAEEIVITSIALTSTIFTQPLTKQNTRIKIPSGSTVSIRMALLALDCENAQRNGQAQIGFRVGEREYVDSFTVRDPANYFSRIQSTGCFAQKVASVATFTMQPNLQTLDVNGRQVAQIAIDVRYMSNDIELLNLRGTTLLAHVDARTLRRNEFRTLAEPRPDRIVISAIPNRCDLHAIAEDKRGTIFPLEVFLSEEQQKGIVLIRAPEQLRDDLYAYVLRTCRSEKE
jgi:hypothetical protein